MWLIYNKIDGKIASVIHEPKEGFLLKGANYDWLDWDAIFVDDFPGHIDAKDCRVINGEIIVVDPETVEITVEKHEITEGGTIHAFPGEALWLKASFFNSFKKPMKVSGNIYWKHDRGLLSPRTATITDKDCARTKLKLPSENIIVMVRCAFSGLAPAYLKIEIV